MMKFRLFNKNVYDYLDFYICYPIIKINKKYKNNFDENIIVNAIKFNTEISYINEEIGWSFNFVLLGFGIYLNRQFTY